MFGLFKKKTDPYRKELEKLLIESGVNQIPKKPIYALIVTDYSASVLQELKNKVETGDLDFEGYKKSLNWNTDHLY